MGNRSRSSLWLSAHDDRWCPFWRLILSNTASARLSISFRRTGLSRHLPKETKNRSGTRNSRTIHISLHLRSYLLLAIRLARLECLCLLSSLQRIISFARIHKQRDHNIHPAQEKPAQHQSIEQQPSSLFSLHTLNRTEQSDRNSFWTSVDIHTFSSHKPDERQSCFLRHGNSRVKRRRNGSNNRYADFCRLENDVTGQSTTQDKKVIVKIHFRQSCPSNHLVNRVVSTNIFSQGNECSIVFVDCTDMYSASFSESCCVRVESVDTVQENLSFYRDV